MGVELKKIYSGVAKSKETEKRDVYVKVSGNGALLGINGSKEKVEIAAKNLYASSHEIIDMSKLDATDLSKFHIIIMGSHDKKVPKAEKLRKFVEDGGYLVTAGRSLDSVLADLFPEVIGYDKKEIDGGFFKGEFMNPDHPFIRGSSKKKTLKFYIEDKSHPVKHVGPSVKELVGSKKLEKKYGSGTLVSAFSHGNGMVIYSLPKFHNLKAGELPNQASAYMLSNILDEAVNKAIPDVIRRGSDLRDMAYVSPTVLDDKSAMCEYCQSAFADYDGKVLKCGSCGILYHQFCLDQQLSAEGTCKKCGKFLVLEQFRQTIVQAPWQPPEQPEQTPPPPPPQ